MVVVCKNLSWCSTMAAGRWSTFGVLVSKILYLWKSFGLHLRTRSPVQPAVSSLQLGLVGRNGRALCLGIEHQSLHTRIGGIFPVQFRAQHFSSAPLRSLEFQGSGNAPTRKRSEPSTSLPPKQVQGYSPRYGNYIYIYSVYKIIQPWKITQNIS